MVVGWIEQEMRNAVAAQEIAQPCDIAQGRCADQHRAAGAGLDQGYAPQDQRAHDLLAERGLRDQQGVQLLRADEQRLYVADRDRVHERAPARKLPELAGKGSSDVIDHRKIMPVPVAAGDADRPRKHDQHAGGRLARLIDPRAGRIAARRAEAPQARDLVGGEDRESLPAARFERRRSGLSHCRGAGASLQGMLVLGFVAAADVSAGPAQAQMHPGIAHLEAFLAAFAARPVGPYQTEVTALHFSRCTSPRLRAAGRAPGTHRRRFRARRAAGAEDPSIGPAPPGPPPGACSCPERARPARTAGALQLPGAGYGRVQTHPFPAVPRFTSLERLTDYP